MNRYENSVRCNIILYGGNMFQGHSFLFIFVTHIILPVYVYADPPTGWLDVVSAGQVAGWAEDPDYDGPIQVHIYVSGTIVKGLEAGDWRKDVGFHGYNWSPPPFGPGPDSLLGHEFIVYAIGVDSTGQPDGENPALFGTPKYLDAGCAGLTGDALVWCEGVKSYWQKRQTDTEMLANQFIRVGVNKSYGGTIFQVYDNDWQNNLTLEHGGAAIQLSLWGYDDIGTGSRWYARYFDNGICDSTPYLTQAECLDAGNIECVERCCYLGTHINDCITSIPCNGWSVGAPWNPIQAQVGPECHDWSQDPSNDIADSSWINKTFYTLHDFPYHFTSNQPPEPMTMEQWVTPDTGFVEIIYRVTYSGNITWSFHPQELPAIFTADGMMRHYYYYGGDSPFTGDSVTHIVGPPRSYLRFPGHDIYGHPDYIDYAREGWWGVCDENKDRCLTVAAFDIIFNEASLHDTEEENAGYITPLGYFPIEPGMDISWKLYLFPYKYDEIIGGKTVRQRIYELATDEFKGRTNSIPAIVEEPSTDIQPTQFTLSPNYPNPFNPSTTIRYSIPKTSVVKLTVYNSVGQEITTLVSEKQLPGEYEIQWNGKSQKGVNVPSGIYFYRLKTDTFTETRRMTLLH